MKKSILFITLAFTSVSVYANIDVNYTVINRTQTTINLGYYVQACSTLHTNKQGIPQHINSGASAIITATMYANTYGCRDKPWGYFPYVFDWKGVGPNGCRLNYKWQNYNGIPPNIRNTMETFGIVTCHFIKKDDYNYTLEIIQHMGAPTLKSSHIGTAPKNS
jgi:hypothetical protein